MATKNVQRLKKRKRPAPPAKYEDKDENYNDGKYCVPICVISVVL